MTGFMQTWGVSSAPAEGFRYALSGGFSEGTAQRGSEGALRGVPERAPRGVRSALSGGVRSMIPARITMRYETETQRDRGRFRNETHVTTRE